MTVTLTKHFVRDVLRFCPGHRPSAETCRDIAQGYKALARRGGYFAREHCQKAAQYLELARRLDANSPQEPGTPLWDCHVNPKGKFTPK